MPAIIRRVKKVTKGAPDVRVGLPVGAADYPDGTPVAMVGADNEFGINNPERSFLRSTMAENRDMYMALAKKGGARVLAGDASVDLVLSKIGQVIESDVKAKIVSIQTPPNSQATITMKGSSNPLIDTGHMLGQIKYEVS